MKRTIGTVLIVIGCLFTLTSALNARQAENVSYLIGTFLPGLLFLILGAALCRERARRTPKRSTRDTREPADLEEDRRIERFKTRTNLGVGIGIVSMFVGGGIAQQESEMLLAGVAASLGGWALVLWGCVNYMRWKGYSGWFGLFGYLLLIGIVILVCFPNRRNQLLQRDGSADLEEAEALAEEDRRPGYRFLLTLVPLGLLFVGLSGFLIFVRSNIDPAEWQTVAPAGAGFRALMPGTPRSELKTQETPAGKVELHKFAVEPKGKKELFLIVMVRFPEEVADELGGAQKLLELGRQDLLQASQGQLQAERPIALNGRAGLELEVLPPKGAIIKARVYATPNAFYQVVAHVPKIRLASEDVQKFLNSFQWAAEPGAAPDNGR
jgi:hypothetical protein